MSLQLCLALLLALFLSVSSAMARSIQFATARTFGSSANSPNRIVVADLNGDGIPDLVVNDSFNTLAVFLGKGDGTFNSPTIYTLDFYVTGSVAIADFNGDHRLDLAVVGGDTTGNGLALLTGNGDGTFNPPIYTPTILAGAAVVGVAGDFYNDHNVDIFVCGVGKRR